MNDWFTKLIFVFSFCCIETVVALSITRVPVLRPQQRTNESPIIHRRKVLQHITIAAITILHHPYVSHSADSDTTPADLTSQLYNPDGSLRDTTIPVEAKSQTIQFRLDPSSSNAVVDARTSSSSSSSPVMVRYDLPEKWQPNTYVDSSTGQASCRKISVYRLDTSSTNKNQQQQLLSKAAQRGVTEVLQTERMLGFAQADLISGRTTTSASQQTTYEFDMARAPPTCDAQESENLRLGFCPYNSIYLLSAMAVDDSIYVMCVEADKDQWKQSNAELRRVRSSFRVLVESINV